VIGLVIALAVMVENLRHRGGKVRTKPTTAHLAPPTQGETL
jgi:hypothetical protein